MTLWTGGKHILLRVLRFGIQICACIFQYSDHRVKFCKQRMYAWRKNWWIFVFMCSLLCLGILADRAAPCWAFRQTKSVSFYTPPTNLTIWWLKVDYNLDQVKPGLRCGAGGLMDCQWSNPGLYSKSPVMGWWPVSGLSRLLAKVSWDRLHLPNAAITNGWKEDLSVTLFYDTVVLLCEQQIWTLSQSLQIKIVIRNTNK